MSVKTEQVEKNLVKLTFEVSSEDFAKAINKAYAKNAKKYSVPGFRKGKVPKSVIEKYYTEAVFYDDAVNSVLPDAYEAALKESGVEPAARPEFDVEEIKKGEPVVFTALVTTKPEVELGEYIGLKLPKIEHKVSDSDVEKEVKAAQEQNARLVPADGKKIKKGNIVTIDYVGSVAGVEFEGGKGENYDLEIGSNTFIPGFEDQLVGKKAGDDVDVVVTFPEEYHAPDLAGKEALFKVKIHENKVKELPEINDDFASEVSEFETLEEYKKSIKEKLEKAAADKVKTETENAAVEKAVENAKVELPAAMVDEQCERMVEDFAQRLQYQGLNIEHYMQYSGSSIEQMKESFKPQAEKQLKTTLVLEAISKKENIEVTDEEINDKICEMAKMYNMEADKLKEMLKDSDIENIRGDIKLGKVIDMIVNKAKISKPRAKKEADK